MYICKAVAHWVRFNSLFCQKKEDEVSSANTCQMPNEHTLLTHLHKANHHLMIDGTHLHTHIYIYIYMHALVINTPIIDHTINLS